MSTSAGGATAHMEIRVMRKVMLRLMPFLTAAYFVAGLDRVNVGFAALHMNEAVGLSPSIYGLGAGMFFVSYCFFAVPSNLLMVRVGARLWLGAVMVTWGIISTLMAMTSGPTSFIILRFLLGIAESGFFPGVMLFLTFWFLESYRSRVVALFMVALPISNFLGAPLSGALLSLDGWFGMAGWHWMFIIEAVPAIVMGLSIGLLLPRDIESAKWLSQEEKTWLIERVGSETSRSQNQNGPSFMAIIRKSWAAPLALVYFGGTSINNGIVLWQPQIIKTFNLTDFQVGLVAAIPFAVGSAAMILWGLSSDKRSERIWHVVLPLAAAGIALACSTISSSLPSLLLILCIAIIGTYSFLGPFWALVSQKIPPLAAPIGIGLINSLNQLGNFGATWLIGYVRSSTGSFQIALLPLIAFAALGIVMVLWVGYGRRGEIRNVNEAAVPPESGLSSVRDAHM